MSTKWNLVSVVAALVVPWVAGGLDAQAAAGAGREIRYRQGFEKEVRLKHWVTNGKYKLHFSGTSTEHAVEGKQSLKLDVTLLDGSYSYWSVDYPKPRGIPCAAKPTFSGKLRVPKLPKGIRVGLGNNFCYPELGRTGCGVVAGVEAAKDAWVALKGELRASSYPGGQGGAYADRWYISITGGFAGQRLVVYVDDVRVDGVLPADYEKQEAERRKRVARRFARDLGSARDELKAVVKSAQALKSKPLRIDPRARPGWEEPLSSCLQRLQQMGKEIDGVARAFHEPAGAKPGSIRRLDRVRASVAACEHFLHHHQIMAKALERLAGPYVVLPVEPFHPVAPGGRFAPTLLEPEKLSLFASPGEYEPASFVIYSFQELNKVTVEASDLSSPAGRIPKDRLELRVVKAWFQRGAGWRGRYLIPELLLKEDSLIDVDLAKKQNRLNFKGLPRDARTLQPVHIRRLEPKQFWLTVHVPDGAAPGKYTGELIVKSQGAPSARMPIELDVLNIKLLKPSVAYGIYYRGRIAEKPVKPTPPGDLMSAQRYEAQMRDLKAHGYNIITLYCSIKQTKQGYDFSPIKRVFDIRRKVGLMDGPVPWLCAPVGFLAKPSQYDRIRRLVKATRTFCRANDIPELVFYAIDEASGPKLSAERGVMKVIGEGGGRVTVACYHGFFERVGDLLHIPIVAGVPTKEEIRSVHALGPDHLIYNYANPQAHWDEIAPCVYRHNYGFWLWQSGLDGTCPYVYQHWMGKSYDDFDERAGDMNVTYPSLDGPIPTLLWEAQREGIDDARYMTTLAAAVEAAQKRSPDSPAVKRCAKWLRGFRLEPIRDWWSRYLVYSPAGIAPGPVDLQALRRRVADMILKLQRVR